MQAEQVVLAARAGTCSDKGQVAGAAKANRHIPASLGHGTGTRCRQCRDVAADPLAAQLPAPAAAPHLKGGKKEVLATRKQSC